MKNKKLTIIIILLILLSFSIGKIHEKDYGLKTTQTRYIVTQEIREIANLELCLEEIKRSDEFRKEIRHG